MNKSKIFRVIFLVAVLFFVPSVLFAQGKRSPKFVVSRDSFGPVKIGMTVSQAAKVLGMRVTREEGHEGSECYYASPKSGFKGIAFMMSGTRIARIDIDSKLYATDRGAKIGDTEACIKRLYKGLYKISRHPYVDGHYIEIKSGKFMLIFETDGKRVTSYRVGKPEQVGYIEGCS